MAAALPVLLFFFFHISTASSLQSANEKGSSQRSPHLTGCVSTNMETFRCRWNVGTFQNVSKPGDLRLFYINKLPPHVSPKEWSECPHYSTDRPNECFFNENHTTVWTYYSVQLRSRDEATLYDTDLFLIQDIVQPDPPVGLNWTLLNVSVTGTFYDTMLSWKPPQSADVEMGWMRLQYEVQHRVVDSERWQVVDLVKSTHCSLYGLQTNKDHEVRVRCKMFGGKDFGEFSESVLIHIHSKVSRFPVMALLIFGALCLVAILMLVIISQQEKLMILLLPPVPGPKIKGIDPELLKKGKLRELVSILSSPPDLRPELYNNDPWVEFIDLDIEEQNDRLTDLDCLMDRSSSSNCSPVSIGFRDDDSGHASCCDPDLPGEPEAAPFHPLVAVEEILSKEPASSQSSSPIQSPAAGESLLVAPGREALYTQVSEVQASGSVLLSPEEKAMEMGIEGEKEERKKKELPLLVVNTDHGGNTSELNAGKMSTRLPAGDSAEPCPTAGSASSGQPPSAGDYQRPRHESGSDPSPALPPASVYSIVEGVDRENSLLLTPNSTPAPLIIPKTTVTPDGYLTPDLLGSITP